METWLIITFAALGIVFIGSIVLLIVMNRKPKNRDSVDDVKIVNGVRMTKDNKVLDANGDVKVSLNKGDILLERGKEYTCQRNGTIMPGKYTVLSTDENTKTFNIRLGGLVREYEHFSSIVLLDGDKISAVSHSVILR